MDKKDKGGRPSAGDNKGGKPFAKPKKMFDGEQRFRELYGGGQSKPRPAFDRDEQGGKGEERPYKKPYAKKSEGESGERKPFRKEGDDRPYKKPYAKKSEGGNEERKPFRKEGDEPFYKKFEGKPNRDGEESGSSGEKRPYKKSEGGDRPYKKPYGTRSEGSDRPYKKPYGTRSESDGGDRPYKKPYGKQSESGERKPFRKDGEDRPYKKPYEKRSESGSGERPYKKPYAGKGGDGERKPFRKEDGDRPYKKPYANKSEGESGERKPFRKEEGDRPFKKPFGNKRTFGPSAEWNGSFDKKNDRDDAAPDTRKPVFEDFSAEYDEDDVQIRRTVFPMPLNKFISHSGECSRRDAAELVRQGKVRVNGELILEPGHKIEQKDKVTLAGKKLFPRRDMVYVLLNKPKGFLTTTDDPQGRRTVVELVTQASPDRLFPVGRLDRNTTGLLLMTNDGALAQKLSHPKYEVRKVYQVSLNKPLEPQDFEKILAGLTLEDGPVTVDALSYLDSKSELGLEIHSGKNRIVRRIFESLGYDVEKLDRVMYAGLTKKNLPRSNWRFLTEHEIILLRHFKP